MRLLVDRLKTFDCQSYYDDRHSMVLLLRVSVLIERFPNVSLGPLITFRSLSTLVSNRGKVSLVSEGDVFYRTVSFIRSL
jgi:hypothetical protein